ncbi:unnamed protein product (macronuclear) [Paramecium tetraurelia]|uniref:GAF domain-containing protein n=1 Tax=Paramecium tetraurelia TaxID=5888 RepID=A0C8N9_PARTE|nr:uncharacterized protein GSPATT00036291001 [Paramecium tetraurelia]CAK67156.1 unnamed protein product [Paramecium tetraurelia]|eukprot:XP_001434553.1 hypothetical protein (macronuclear) [Paramecium tetraurelia strain d4-2]
MQQKEIDRLEHQNKNLQVLTQHQCSMLYQERTLRTNSTKLQMHSDLPQQQLPNARNARRSTIKNVLQAMKPPPRKIVVSNKLQMTNNECFKLSSILEATNQQAKQLYHDDSSIQLVKEILKDEDSFIDIITTYPPQQVSIMYDKIKKLINEHEQMFELILKFKSIIDNSFSLQNIKLQLEALNQLSQQCKNILECKNAQIITHTDETSKSYIQHVYNNKQILNLKNAKFDERFKNENFNQLLAAPILDNNRCLGVIVCQDKSINFSDEDEILIQYICRQAQYILNNQKFNFRSINTLSKACYCCNKSMIQILNYTSQNRDFAKL